jgi:hypothetical protein
MICLFGICPRVFAPILSLRMKIPWPQHESWPDAKRIIAAIISASGGQFTGRTRLYKAFYRAHVEYWKAQSRRLTKHQLVCMPQGPGIDGGDLLIDEMVRDKTIKTSRVIHWHMTSEKYTLLDTGAVTVNEDEMDAVHKALEWLAGLTATEASNKSHAQSRSWNLAKEAGLGVPLQYELDALNDDEYARLDAAYEASKGQLAEFFRIA